MNSILVIYSTTDGHTLEICRRIQRIVEELGDQVSLVPVNSAGAVDLKAFDKIVIGASIRYGKHSRAVYDFISNHSQDLDDKPNAFFSVNLVARKVEKRTPETNPYVRTFLRQIAWKPKRLEIFAGKLDYQIYRFWDRLMIRFIMWMTKGPTDPNANIDYTDWDQVDEFGRAIHKM